MKLIELKMLFPSMKFRIIAAHEKLPKGQQPGAFGSVQTLGAGEDVGGLVVGSVVRHRERAVDVVVVVKGQRDLLHVVDALRPPRGLSGRLARPATAGRSARR